MCIVTKHAEDRAKQRLGIPKRGAQRAADRALEKGLTYSEARGKLKRLMLESSGIENNLEDLRIFQGSMYVFAGETLITVFHVPRDFQKAALAQEARKKERRQNAVMAIQA